ncbi:Zinc-finger double domain containing protein, partial [Euroglyphus maynei]
FSQPNDYRHSLTSSVLNSEIQQLPTSSSLGYLNGQSSTSSSSSTANTDYPRFHHDANFDSDKGNSAEKPAKTTRGRKKSKKGPFICVECRKEFCNQSTLTKHMITHSDERKFVCPQCSKAFKRHDHLNGHMLTHREHKPYACDIDGCDKSYCDARSLRRHKEKHKEGALQQFLERMSCLSNIITISLFSFIPIASHSTTTTTTTRNENDDKANDPYQLPIKASTHLQLLALQQRKIHSDGNDQIIASNHNNHNKFKHITVDNDLNLSDDNALLHQLLTSNHPSTDKSFSNDHRQPIIPNNNLTVIKINDNYINNGNQSTTTTTTAAAAAERKMPESSKTIESSSSSSVECSLCLKKFESIDALNAHLMKLHQHSDDSTLKTNPFQPQPLNPTYEMNMKNYESEISKNFANIYNHDHQIHPFHQQHDATNEMAEFRNIFHHTSQQNYLMTSTGDKQMVGNNSHLYSSQQQSPNIIVDESQLPHRTNYAMIHDNELSQPQPLQQQQQQQQTKGLNEVMFSPITPVTPLKNGSQFTFEFSNAQPLQPPDKDDDVVVVVVAQTDQSAKIDDTDAIGNYVQSLEPDFSCFDAEKNDENVDLLQKSSADQNFINHHDEQEFFPTTTKHDEPSDAVTTVKDMTTTSTFNSFDLPSTKLTSDLFNRRIQRIHS